MALNTTDRVVVVMMLADPPGRLMASEGSCVAFAVALVGDEPTHVVAVQRARVVPAAGCVALKEGAEFDGGPPDSVDDTGGAGAPWRLQQVGEIVPGQVPQPALRDISEVDMTGPVVESHPGVLGLQEPGVLRLGGSEVNQPQLVQDLLGDRTGELGAPTGAELEADQRVHVLGPAGRHQ